MHAASHVQQQQRALLARAGKPADEAPHPAVSPVKQSGRSLSWPPCCT